MFKFTLLIATLAVSLFLSSCSEVEFNNPIDPDGPNADIIAAYPDALKDDDGDGKLNVVDEWKDIHFKDSTAPQITLKGSDTVYLVKGDRENKIAQFLDVNNTNLISATDPEGGDVTIKCKNGVDVFTTSAPDPPYVIEYTATDNDGNYSTAYRYVHVVPEEIIDTDPPVLQIGDTIVNLALNQEFIPQTPSAYDLGDGAKVEVVVTGKVDVTKADTYKLEYTATDSKNNSITLIKTVIVSAGPQIDTVAPVLTLLGADTVELPDGQTDIQEFMKTFSDPGCSAIDNVDGDISSKVKESGLQIVSARYHYIEYSITDIAGNSAQSVTRVFDTHLPDEKYFPPVIVLVYGDSILPLIKGTKWVEPGFAVTDVQDTTIPNSEVTVDSSELIENLNTLGTYTVTYTVTNSLGLTTVKKRYVKVALSGIDRFGPVITLKGRNPDTCLAQSKYVEPGYEAIDDIDGDVTSSVVVTGTVNIKKFGKNILSYSAIDSKGNRSELLTRTVWVVPDTETTDLLVRYNVPSEDTLKAISGTFTSFNTDGDGPVLDESNIKSIKFEWSPPGQYNQAQLQFQITYDGEPYNKDFNSSTIKSALSKPGALMRLSGTEIDGLDDSYYVTIKDDSMVWVQEDGDFAILLTAGRSSIP